MEKLDAKAFCFSRFGNSWIKSSCSHFLHKKQTIFSLIQGKNCWFLWGNEGPEMRTNKFAFEISWPLKTVTDDTGKAHFTIVLGCLQNRNPNQFYFTESYLQIAYEIFRPNFAALRKNPISLEEMAKVKIATSGVNLESLYLPPRIKPELKKYQDLNKTFIGLADWQYCLTHYGTPGQLWGIFKIE